MIYNMWYGVLDSKEVKKNKPLFAKRLNKKGLKMNNNAYKKG